MPVLLSESEVCLEWSDINTRYVRRRTKPIKRSPGVHLSGVIKYVLTTSGTLKTEDTDDEMPLRMAVGMATEDWFVGLWPHMVWQPGECSLDGVTGSPDGLTPPLFSGLALRDSLLEEFKATWKSAHTHGDVLKEKIWMWQLSGYCKMLGINHARLHVLFVNGNYRPPSPRYVTYLLRFSQEELDRFWKNVILRNVANAIPEEH